jgi:hypothetical protein
VEAFLEKQKRNGVGEIDNYAFKIIYSFTYFCNMRKLMLMELRRQRERFPDISLSRKGADISVIHLAILGM